MFQGCQEEEVSAQEEEEEVICLLNCYKMG